MTPFPELSGSDRSAGRAQSHSDSPQHARDWVTWHEIIVLQQEIIATRLMAMGLTIVPLEAPDAPAT
jgi:hypothetical protein